MLGTNTGVSRAKFDVDGQTSANYNIDAIGPATLIVAAGTPGDANDEMTFTFSVDGGLTARTLSAADPGVHTINIGGTLSAIDATQKIGIYTASAVSITIRYE